MERVFQFEIIMNVLVSSFRFIWIPMLWVYGHYKDFYSYMGGVDFRRQNLTSTDVRFWRLKSIPALQGVRFPYLSKRYAAYYVLNEVKTLWKYSSFPRFVSLKSLLIGNYHYLTVTKQSLKQSQHDRQKRTHNLWAKHVHSASEVNDNCIIINRLIYEMLLRYVSTVSPSGMYTSSVFEGDI